MVYALFIRPEIDLTVAPVRNPTYVVLSDGSIRNTYDIRLRNKHGEDRPFRLTAHGDPTYRIALEGSVFETVTVPANETRLQRVYVTVPPSAEPATSDTTAIRFWVEDLTNGERAMKDSTFNGREAQ